MTTTLSNQDWSQLWDESVCNGSISLHSDGCDRFEQGQIANLCKIYDRTISLRDGLSLRIYNHEILDTLIFKTQCSTHSYFALSFFVSGNVQTTLHNVIDEVLESTGKNYLSYYSGVRETEELQAGQNILRVKILVEPKYLFSAFGAESIEQLSPELLSLVAGNDLQPYYHLGTTTLLMQQAVQQILNCPYQGLMRRMYLESKALELITLRFEQLLQDSRQTTTKSRLQQDAIDRIHLAKDILTANFEHPPSLIELARQAGLNDCTLKRGFREVFGTTAFGYLRDYRIEQARKLLLEDHLNVSEIAHRLGFASYNSLSRGFRKKYGVTPKQYRKTGYKL